MIGVIDVGSQNREVICNFLLSSIARNTFGFEMYPL